MLTGGMVSEDGSFRLFMERIRFGFLKKGFRTSSSFIVVLGSSVC